MLDIESTPLEKAVLLKVSGRLDAGNTSQFQNACDVWIAKGAQHLVVDLSQLQYVSSMGLSSFLGVAKALQPIAGSLILCGLRGFPKQVFEMTALIGLFPVFETTEAALASL